MTTPNDMPTGQAAVGVAEGFDSTELNNHGNLTRALQREDVGFLDAYLSAGHALGAFNDQILKIAFGLVSGEPKYSVQGYLAGKKVQLLISKKFFFKENSKKFFFKEKSVPQSVAHGQWNWQPTEEERSLDFNVKGWLFNALIRLAKSDDFSSFRNFYSLIDGNIKDRQDLLRLISDRLFSGGFEATKFSTAVRNFSDAGINLFSDGFLYQMCMRRQNNRAVHFLPVFDYLSRNFSVYVFSEKQKIYCVQSSAEQNNLVTLDYLLMKTVCVDNHLTDLWDMYFSLSRASSVSLARLRLALFCENNVQENLLAEVGIDNVQAVLDYPDSPRLHKSMAIVEYVLERQERMSAYDDPVKKINFNSLATSVRNALLRYQVKILNEENKNERVKSDLGSEPIKRTSSRI